jgi:hypothetical protein
MVDRLLIKMIPGKNDKRFPQRRKDAKGALEDA